MDPSDREAEVVLRDGSTVHVRLVRAEDLRGKDPRSSPTASSADRASANTIKYVLLIRRAQ